MTLQAILSVSLVLFTVIDIAGSLPVIIDLKRQGMAIHAAGATMVAGLLMLAFLFFGASVLRLLGIEVGSFALAGSLVIFFIGLEMTLGIRFFRSEPDMPASGTVVPIAFPLVAGAGTLTTLLSLKAAYSTGAILAGMAINLLIVFAVLHSSGYLAQRIPASALASMRKVFGILLIAIAIQMLRTHWG